MQTYSLLLGVGTLTGLLLTCWRAPLKELSCYINAGIWALVGTLVGSRAVTVAVNFSYYQAHPREIFQIWMGGLSGIGALAAGALSILIVAKWKNINTGALADALFPLAGTLMVTAWLGSWVGRSSYGFASDAWFALPSPDEWGLMGKRVPVQLIGALLALALTWLLEHEDKRFPVLGMDALVGLFGLSAVMFILSFLRADPMPVFYGLRLEAWGAAGLMALSVLGTLILFAFGKRKQPRQILTS